jgi:hypothetical protein
MLLNPDQAKPGTTASGPAADVAEIATIKNGVT